MNDDSKCPHSPDTAPIRRSNRDMAPVTGTHPPVVGVFNSATLIAVAQLTLVILFCVLPTLAHGRQESPPAAPRYAPDRDYDLHHISIDLTLDPEQHSFQGSVVNTLASLRAGLRIIRFDCGENLSVTGCEIDGCRAAFSHAGEQLEITAPKALPPGKSVAVTVRYFDSGKTELPKTHWIKPTAGDPHHIGFWTSGEPYYNRRWMPTWDYPNDLATMEMRVTVPADWYVVSNGILKSNRLRPAGKARTFDWRMDEPCATYLISLVAGPFDIQTDEWRGVELMYVVPKGKGSRIGEIFGDTPDMLSFFSDALGVKYPWPKYAQTIVYDFGGGQESVSATTIEAGDWGDIKSGFKTSDHGQAHELAHQWFGDLVTINHWGEMWLKGICRPIRRYLPGTRPR